MTRARDHLYAYAPLRYHFRPRAAGDGHGYAQLSRFLAPPVLECLDDVTPSGPRFDDDADQKVVVHGIAAVDRMMAALWD
jgi:hypothetical protein